MFYVRNRPKVKKADKNYYNYSKSKTSEITAGNNYVKTFTKNSLSNRCLYQKSVRKFDRNNYRDLDLEKFSEISNKGIYLFDLPWAF